MTLTIPRRLVSNALAQSLSTSTGRPITVMEGATTIEPQGLADLFPYAFLEPLRGMTGYETLSKAQALVEWPYRFRCCGQNVDQAEALADRLRERLIDTATNPITLVGYRIIGISVDGGPGTPEKESDDFWSVPEDYLISVGRG